MKQKEGQNSLRHESNLRTAIRNGLGHFPLEPGVPHQDFFSWLLFQAGTKTAVKLSRNRG
jgi:hypothetical protein